MSRKALWAMLVLLPAAGVLSGCVSCVEGPPVSARGITDAPSAAGVMGFELDVLVTDGPRGPPLPGAGVVVYYGGTDASEWQGPRVEVRDDEVIVEPINATGTVESKSVDRLMTDASGHARAKVPGNRIVGVVVAKDGYTEEWVPALAAGASGTSGTIAIPLYRAQLAVDIDGVWAPAGASPGFATESRYAWDPRPVEFGDNADAQRGYAARVVEMRLTLEWQNGATGGGDLGIGVGPPEEGPRYFQDRDTNLAQGAQTEQAAISLQELRERGILGAPSIEAGAATDSAFVAPFGLPWTLRVEALFDTARAAFAACTGTGSRSDNDGLGADVPAPGLALGALAVAGAALLAGRRR